MNHQTGIKYLYSICHIEIQACRLMQYFPPEPCVKAEVINIVQAIRITGYQI